jgi:endonuclease V-like protein UPF0215 family
LVKRLHILKPGIRVLGIAESFTPGKDRYSTVAGVVMRKDRLIIDGVGFVRTRVGGDDATEKLVKLYHSLKREDINALMLSGAVISHYNIIDIDALAKRTDRPVICLTYRESSGIEDSIRIHFGDDAENKVEAYRKLGKRVGLDLSTGKRVFVRCAQIETQDASRLVESFLIQGRYPEPVRVASLLAASAKRL